MSGFDTTGIYKKVEPRVVACVFSLPLDFALLGLHLLFILLLRLQQIIGGGLVVLYL